jgi:hypothetical protein
MLEPANAPGARSPRFKRDTGIEGVQTPDYPAVARKQIRFV